MKNQTLLKKLDFEKRNNINQDDINIEPMYENLLRVPVVSNLYGERTFHEMNDLIAYAKYLNPTFLTKLKNEVYPYLKITGSGPTIKISEI